MATKNIAFFPYIDEPGKVAGYRVFQDNAGFYWEWMEDDETLFAEGPFATYVEALGAAFEDSESTLLRNSLTSKLQSNIMAAWAVDDAVVHPGHHRSAGPHLA